MIKGFETAVMGMALNEKKTVTLPPEEAYGQPDENLTRYFPRKQVPPDVDPQVGQSVTLTNPQGQPVPARVVAVDDEKIALDMNHPLAGEALTFEIEVVTISDTPTQQAAGCGSGCDCSSGCEC
jgi:peptidylprolyl isomerase